MSAASDWEVSVIGTSPLLLLEPCPLALVQAAFVFKSVRHFLWGFHLRLVWHNVGAKKSAVIQDGIWRPRSTELSRLVPNTAMLCLSPQRIKGQIYVCHFQSDSWFLVASNVQAIRQLCIELVWHAQFVLPKRKSISKKKELKRWICNNIILKIKCFITL